MPNTMGEVDLRRYLLLLWKWLWLLILATAIAGAVSYRFSQFLPRIYRTSTTLIVGEETTNPNPDPNQIATSQRLAGVYAAMVQRQPILESTIAAQNLPMSWQALQSQVISIHGDGSQLFEIRVADSDPNRAKLVADELSRQIILQSPTVDITQQQGDRRAFVKQQLDTLQGNITSAEKTIADKQVTLQTEVSARGVLDRQDEIQALELKVTGWRSAYASLLTAYQGKPPNTLTVVAPAYIPSEPISPNVRTNVLTAALLGLVLAVGAVLALEFFNDTVANGDDIRRIASLPLLGTITRIRGARKPAKAIIASADPYSIASESYRLLGTTISFACAEATPGPILITSPGVHEGKSITSANLGITFAQMGKAVIIVDADLRHPTQHLYFTCPNERGLSTLISNVGPLAENQPVGVGKLERIGGGIQETINLDDLLVTTPVSGLRILPSGPCPPNPAELLGSSRMSQILRALQDRADIVIFDTPPVLPVADTRILAGKGVATILVVEADRTTEKHLLQAAESLERTRSRILGIVLNRASTSNLPYGNFKYHAKR